MYAKSLWYADGLRWLGTVLTEAADEIERRAPDVAPLDPREYRRIDEYVAEVRSRAHTHF